MTGDNVNLRSEPNTNSSILTTLAQGASLTVLGQQGDWYQVKANGNQTGWVAGWLIDVTKQQDAIPPGTPSISIINPDTNA
ncbi:SH3 domain-containing protein, partial [Frankia sp. Cpl3]|nr:SH3 domain-containing protein [Frankia sp. Cpl3]